MSRTDKTVIAVWIIILIAAIAWCRYVKEPYKVDWFPNHSEIPENNG